MSRMTLRDEGGACGKLLSVALPLYPAQVQSMGQGTAVPSTAGHFSHASPSRPSLTRARAAGAQGDGDGRMLPMHWEEGWTLWWLSSG